MFAGLCGGPGFFMRGGRWLPVPIANGDACTSTQLKQHEQAGDIKHEYQERIDPHPEDCVVPSLDEARQINRGQRNTEKDREQ
jgi:hypothetical protein